MKYMFNFIDHLHFIPVRGCVGRDSSEPVCLGAYNAVKMALLVSMAQNQLVPNSTQLTDLYYWDKMAEPLWPVRCHLKLFHQISLQPGTPDPSVMIPLT